ncbi:MAG TPA: hypothetical protein VMV27_14830 [Candidatus Binataceae bacterium]|nr:hypothetical protein [Candidatus Binataceae bacterium]
MSFVRHLRFLTTAITLTLFLVPAVACAQAFAGVTTYHNDNMRTGQNLAETVLTTANVNSTTFGKLRTWPVDGYVYAQPLYLASVKVRGHRRNVVFIATEHDSVYAFDPALRKDKPLWKTSFLSVKYDITTVPSGLVGSTDIVPEIGITSTPVIDPATGTIFVVAKTFENGTNFVLRLHALQIKNGKERKGSPVELNASVAGIGDGNNGQGQVPFDAKTANQRSALALVNGVVYIASAGHNDVRPYHGWILGYDETTLQQVSVFNSTPNGFSGAVWMSGDGPASDATNDLYVSTGNGTFDANEPGGLDYGDSFLKLGDSGGAFGVLDYFTPWDQASFLINDLDLGSGGLLLLPDQPGAVPHLALGGGKNGNFYMVNRDAMGGYNTATDDNSQIVQELDGQVGQQIYCTPAYWNESVYFNGSYYPLTQFRLTGGLLSTTPTYIALTPFGWPGAVPAVSADGASNGIVWEIRTEYFADTSGHAVLYAFDANDVANELYDSNQAGDRDLPGPAVKFSVPTVANGSVFVGGQYSVTMFGLLPQAKKRRR